MARKGIAVNMRIDEDLHGALVAATEEKKLTLTAAIEEACWGWLGVHPDLDMDQLNNANLAAHKACLAGDSPIDAVLAWYADQDPTPTVPAETLIHYALLQLNLQAILTARAVVGAKSIQERRREEKTKTRSAKG